MRTWCAVLACVSSCAPGGHGASPDAIAGASRCSSTGATLTCQSETVQLDGRTVTYEVPLGAPPATGWPSVVFYQGSFIPGSHAFSASPSDAFGQYELTSTIQALLDRGYAVIAPDALGNGMQFWETNVPPYASSWTGCEDDVLVHQLLATMSAGRFGPLDAARRYAMGISSGGFMTSRMAVSYDGAFRALAIASASYATCSSTCTVPALPPDHPPTLFLHGGQDMIVPINTMTPYRDQLVANGRIAEAVIDPAAGHQWLHEAIIAVPSWFDAH